MEKKILHICESNAFLKFAICHFDRLFPNQNIFLLNTDFPIHGDFNYSDFPFVFSCSYSSVDYHEYMENIELKYFLVIFHNIGPPYKGEIAEKIYGKVPLHGILWGFEIFNSEKLKKKIYLKDTRVYLEKNNKVERETLKLGFRKLLNYYVKPNSYWNRHWGIFDKLSSYSTILKSEKAFIEKYYRTKKTYFPFNYSGGYDVEGYQPLRRGKSILIGNSASISNNHVDILSLLKKTHLDPATEIILPLSYGNPRYADFVEKSFKEVFRDKVICLRNFVSLEDYSKIISSCAFVVMNHIRQQAMGNIFLSLVQGAKVFLNKKSFGYRELSDHKLKIYTIEDFRREYPNQESDEIINYNRKIIYGMRGDDAIRDNIIRIVNHYRLV